MQFHFLIYNFLKKGTSYSYFSKRKFLEFLCCLWQSTFLPVIFLYLVFKRNFFKTFCQQKQKEFSFHLLSISLHMNCSENCLDKKPTNRQSAFKYLLSQPCSSEHNIFPLICSSDYAWSSRGTEKMIMMMKMESVGVIFFLLFILRIFTFEILSRCRC